jgi:hypothetical protein
MDNVTVQPAYHRMALQESLRRLGRRYWYGLKISWQNANFADFLLWAEKEIFILAVEPGQRAHNIARVCADAEFGDPANVDRNSHTRILPTEGA